MLDSCRLRGLMGLCVGLLFAAASCKSGDGESQGFGTDECADACAKIAASDCGDVGSECVDHCVHGPVPSPAGSAADCAQVESAYFNCFWSADSYICDEALGTLPVGCETERAAVASCENTPTVGAGGAAGESGASSPGGANLGGANLGGAAGAP